MWKMTLIHYIEWLIALVNRLEGGWHMRPHGKVRAVSTLHDGYKPSL